MTEFHDDLVDGKPAPELEIILEPTQEEVIEALEDKEFPEGLPIVPVRIFGEVMTRTRTADDCGPEERLDDIFALTMATPSSVNSYTLSSADLLNFARLALACHQKMYRRPTIETVGGKLMTSP